MIYEPIVWHTHHSYGIRTMCFGIGAVCINYETFEYVNNHICVFVYLCTYLFIYIFIVLCVVLFQHNQPPVLLQREISEFFFAKATTSHAKVGTTQPQMMCSLLITISHLTQEYTATNKEDGDRHNKVDKEARDREETENDRKRQQAEYDIRTAKWVSAMNSVINQGNKCREERTRKDVKEKVEQEIKEKEERESKEKKQP